MWLAKRSGQESLKPCPFPNFKNLPFAADQTIVLVLPCQHEVYYLYVDIVHASNVLHRSFHQ
jgi:hypothetical protein